jgi:ribosome biogenesis GTPase A
MTLPGGVQLLDTPGILVPKIEDLQVGLKLAFCGSVRDEIFDIAELGLEFIRFMMREFPGVLEERFELGQDVATEKDDMDEVDPSLMLMERIAAKRGYILSGGRIDYERTGKATLGEYRSGKLGRLTLDLF